MTGLGTMSSAASAASASNFSFVQISDSHIGVKLAANDHVADTLKLAVDAINALPAQPAFVVHTGDVTHLSKAAEFDDAKQILSALKAPLIAIPGEHDVIGDSGKNYFATFGRKEAQPEGWYSFDMNGTHFVALVNVFNFETMGLLGAKQIDWLRRDLASRKVDTPVVVFGHVPLYALYEKWGWTTEDGTQALALLRRFSSVTVLNGHIHQVIEHTDGNIRFATLTATAYPQPAPGTAEKPGPLVVPKDRLLSVLGYRTVELSPATPPRIAQHALG
ncbi:MAG: metallophosphoesterase [Candidatus Eremiobacteraeota bacterium]|nr:metallophosphoesterase [Candidatus Eremiobacteraeota bacterium]